MPQWDVGALGIQNFLLLHLIIAVAVRRNLNGTQEPLLGVKYEFSGQPNQCREAKYNERKRESYPYHASLLITPPGRLFTPVRGR